MFVKGKGSSEMLKKDKHWDHLWKKEKEKESSKHKLTALFQTLEKIKKIIILGTWKIARRNI